MSTRHDEFDDLSRVLDEAGCLSHVLNVVFARRDQVRAITRNRIGQ